MPKATKWLLLFELLGALAGWLWIIASLGVIVCIIGALFFGFSWWNALYVVIFAALGKWILRGSENVQNIRAVEYLKTKGLSDSAAQKTVQTAYMNYGPDGVQRIYELSDDAVELLK